MGCVCCRPLQQQQQPQLTLLLVGLDNGGKTTLVNALRGELHGDTTATFGFSTHSITSTDGSPLLVYDLGGGRGIRRIWQTYVAEVHGVVFVLDAADAGRFPEARAALHTLLQAPQLAGKPLLVFANKQDRPGAASCEAVAAALQLPHPDSTLQQEQQLGHEQPPQLLHSIVPCTAKAAAEQQAADPALQQGLQWLVSSIRPRYGQLQEKIDREAAAARLQEQLRRQEREQRAAANRAQREKEEQEAAAAAAAAAMAAVAAEKSTVAAAAKLREQSAATREEGAGQQQLIAAGTQSQAAGRNTAATPAAAAAIEVSQSQAANAAGTPAAKLPAGAAPPAAAPAAAAPASSGLTQQGGSEEEQAAAAEPQCSPSETPSSSPDKLSSLVVAPGRQEDTASDCAAITPAAVGRPGPLGSLLSMLLLPGAATSSSLETLQFSDLRLRAAEQHLETTPRVHSLTSEASSLCPEPSGLPGRGARAIAAATSRRAAAAAAAARPAGPEARRRSSGAGTADPSRSSKAMMRSASMPTPGADAAVLVAAGGEVCSTARLKGRGSLMAGNRVQPLE